MTEAEFGKVWSGRPNNKPEDPKHQVNPILERIRNPRGGWGKSVRASAAILSIVLAACGGEKKVGVTLTPSLTPTVTVARETMETGLPSTRTSIVETPTIQPISPVIPTETAPTPESQTIFEKLRKEINDSQETDKEYLLGINDEVEKTYAVLTELKNHSDSFLESDGTPTLIALETARLGNFDATPLFPNQSPNEARETMAEDEIFFLQDLRRIDSLQASLDSSLNLSQSAQLLRDFDKEFFQTGNNEFYLGIGSKIDQEGNFSIEVDPSVTGPSEFRTIDEDLSIINQTLQRFPKIGNLRIILIPGSGSETILYSDPTQPVEIRLGRDVFQLEPKILDELGSVFDIKINYKRLAPYYSPEEIVRLLIEREKAVEKYRDFPSIEKMLDHPDPKSFDYAVTVYPDAIFWGQGKELFGSQQQDSQQEMFPGPLQEPLFAQYLKNPLLDQLSQETQEQTNPYFDWTSFTAGEQTRIQALIDSNAFMKLAFESLDSQKNTDSFKDWTAISSVGTDVPLGSKYLSEYYQRVVPTYLNMALTEMLANGDPKLLALLTPAQTEDLLENYRLLLSDTSDELWARTISRAMLFGVEEGDPTQNYFQLLWHNPSLKIKGQQ